MHFSDAPPRRASDFPLSTKRIYIYKVAAFLGGRKHLKSRHAEWRASGNRIWTYLLKQKSVSFCTFREVACAGPLKYQGNVVLEHRFCTAHPLHAKCKTYASYTFMGYSGGPAEATSWKVQHDTLFSLLGKVSPNGIPRCAQFCVFVF